MKLLIHHDEYNRQQYWLADTPARLDGAKRALFQHLDGQGCYDRLCSEFGDLLTAARKGDIRYINAILKLRNGIKGETWQLESPMIAEDKTRRYVPFMAAAIHNLTKQCLYSLHSQR